MIKIGYMTLTPESTGSPIVGPSVYKMAADTIEIVDIQHKVTHEYDRQHGTVSGDRHHDPLLVIKSVDCTTPTLYAMCCNAEMFTEVKVDYYVQVGNAPDPVPFFTWRLTNAYITSIRSISSMELRAEYADQYDLLEEVQFSYQQIEWEHYAHRAPVGLKELEQVIMADAWSLTG